MIANKMKAVKWWFLHRFHPKHRYHIIDTGRGPGWCDRDELMAVLIRKIIIDFVEKEKPYDHWDTVNSQHKEEWEKLKEVYEYFKANENCSLTSNMDEYEKLTDYCVEAVRLRSLLWT